MLLQKKQLGATGLVVSNICWGGGPFRRCGRKLWTWSTEAAAIATVRAMLKSPVNFLDTARAYGESEIRSGRFNISMGAVALQFSLRDQRFSSTIVGVSTPEEVAQTISFAGEKVPDDLWEEIQPFGIKDGNPEIARKEAERKRKW